MRERIVITDELRRTVMDYYHAHSNNTVKAISEALSLKKHVVSMVLDEHFENWKKSKKV